MKFADLGLSDELLRAIDESGYDEATPIQGRRDPVRIDDARHHGIAQTGTGKTASLRVADDRYSGPWPRPRADAALADPRADPRTRRARSPRISRNTASITSFRWRC
ncbi:DEAD/DEAH box helicase [Aphelenchoides bicaudatus]|nr:DEAD/DEAH box helicase [Aphelenchoides bicaudatus]